MCVNTQWYAFHIVWLWQTLAPLPSMSSSGKDINMYQHVWDAFCTTLGQRNQIMLRTWIPRSSSIPWLGCNPFLWVILQWYRNISKCVKIYQNVSECIKMYQHVSECIKMHFITSYFWPSDWKAWGPPCRSSDAIPAIRRLWQKLKWRNIQSIPNNYKTLQTRKSPRKSFSKLLKTSYPTFV